VAVWIQRCQPPPPPRSFKRARSDLVVIGTGPECDVVLPDPSLSRSHARLTYLPDDKVSVLAPPPLSLAPVAAPPGG
jgi:hypothetical protein